MHNNLQFTRTKKWDVILLIFFILLFIVAAGGTIYLAKERGEQEEKVKTTLFEKNLYLAELETITATIAHGESESIKALNGQILKMERFDDNSSDWNSLIRNSKALRDLATSEVLATTFFDKEKMVISLDQIAEQAGELAHTNSYQHPVISSFLNANATMDLVSNLLYSGEREYLDDAFIRIKNSVNTRAIVRSYIERYNDLIALYHKSAILDQIAGAEEAIMELLSAKDQLIAQIARQTADTNRYISNPNLHKISNIETPLISLPHNAPLIGFLIAVVALLTTLTLIFRILSERSKVEEAAMLQNQKNEEAIFEMLDVIYALSEGDLTVQAKVTDHFTGTLADSFNMSVDGLRGLVKAVGDSSDRLAGAVHTAIDHADEFTEASLSQAMQITEATNIVSHVTKAMLDVSTQTSAAVDIAMSSTEVARSGSERVRSTITGMDQIREHIQETSKRIKRLGESSQEIGDVVELINDIADQTHILALNAAIQASAAGEAGKGFAVVADEVQRLAERTGNATSRVEALVKTIQSDTNEAIFAMEKSTSEVVNGANLAERAGESLTEIESVSGRLAGLIQSVSQASREVSELGGQVQSSMTSVKELSEKNVENTKTTKSAIEALEKLADELKDSISGFKI